jgi:hypothetical protein
MKVKYIGTSREGYTNGKVYDIVTQKFIRENRLMVWKVYGKDDPQGSSDLFVTTPEEFQTLFEQAYTFTKP